MLPNRIERVCQAVKEEVSDILLNRLRTPLPGLVTVTRVTITRDLRHAVVFYSQMAPAKAQEATHKILRNAAGFIQSEVSHALRLRRTPDFTFEFDRSIEYGIHIARIVSELKKSETRDMRHEA